MNRKDVQRNTPNSKTRWNDTNSTTQTAESDTSSNNLSLTESCSETKAKIMTTKVKYGLPRLHILPLNIHVFE